MDQFLKTLFLVYPVQLVQAGTESISHDAVVGAYYPCKKSEAQDSLSVIMLQAFVVDQGDLFIQYGMEHGLVVRLLFFGMGKEEICFSRDQFFFRNFFDTHQDIAVLQVMPYFHSCRGIFLIGITAVGGRLGDDPYLVGVPVDPFTLCRREGYPVIGGSCDPSPLFPPRLF